jgi:Uma2 family endonuclease
MTIATDRPSQITTDQLIILKGDWAQFKLIKQGCENNANVRLSYFDGTIEILMPGRPHEVFSHAIGVLLTLYLAYQGIAFLAVGSADQINEGQAAAQPDQSYCLGTIKPIPDLSIEIVFSSGGINKLARYQNLGVREVWFWQDGTLKLYHLRSHGYEQIDRSKLPGLEALDLAVLKRHILMGETDTGEAVRAFNTYLAQS